MGTDFAQARARCPDTNGQHFLPLYLPRRVHLAKVHGRVPHLNMSMAAFLSRSHAIMRAYPELFDMSEEDVTTYSARRSTATIADLLRMPPPERLGVGDWCSRGSEAE